MDQHLKFMLIGVVIGNILGVLYKYGVRQAKKTATAVLVVPVPGIGKRDGK